MAESKTSGALTQASGAPVDDDNNSLTVGPQGPILLRDLHLIDKLAHFDRERIPERVVHAKGAGAYGYFEVTHDVTQYCKAKFLSEVGKKTPVCVRFSTVGGEKGSADSARDPRGFAIKHYTEDGNYDMTGNNTPVFFIRDPTKFPDFIHTQKRNPQTNLPDADAFWDFITLTPETLHQVTILFSNRGTPYGYRHMNGYSSHAFKWVNAANERFYVQLHYKTDQGIKNFTGAEADAMKAQDADWATRDLFDAIKRGEAASWTAFVQVMPEADAAKYKYNVLDITKVWPHADYPLIPYGKLVLDRNPKNYFAEVEQVAFSPGHLVPGVEPSEDKMLQARLFSYPDTHRHRLGANYEQIPVNCPLRKPFNYQRDGFMCINGNGGSMANYFPNSIDGTPQPDPSAAISPYQVSGTVGRFQAADQHPNDDFEQVNALYSKVMTDEDRNHLIMNIVGHLKNAKEAIRQRAVRLFTKINPEYGQRIADGLKAAGC